jgi:hypothetical protein
MRFQHYLTENTNRLIIEGKMESELSAQIFNIIRRDKKKHDIVVLNVGESTDLKAMCAELSSQILDADATRSKTFRYLIRDWVLSGEINLKEDTQMLSRDLKEYDKSGSTKKDFATRSDLGEFILNIKNTGIVDDKFDYTFDIDYNDKRFTIYLIQEKDKQEYMSKLGDCTTWCITTNEMFDAYTLPYYLLVDKKEQKQYAIVPGGGQFKDSKQNAVNSEKKFEEFDKILNLRKKYYNMKPSQATDTYIYMHDSIDLDVQYSILFMNGTYKLNSDNSVDFNGSLNDMSKFFKNGELVVNFNHVTSYTFGVKDIPLKTLKGFPKVVDGIFIIRNTGLESLKFGPTSVTEFNVTGNNLKSLEFGPQHVAGAYAVFNNNLISLEGAPEKIGDLFSCQGNNITSLKGGPLVVVKSYWASDNKYLKSLEGAPTHVGYSFDVTKCPMLSKEEVENLANRVSYKIESDYGFFNK